MWSRWVRALVSSLVALGGLGAAPVAHAATEGWQGASVLSAGYQSNPVVALAADGTAIAAWDGTSDRYVAVRTPGSTSFGEPVDLGDAHEGGGPAVATDANGDSVMAWLAESPVGVTEHQIVFEVDVDYRPAGGQFSESTVTTVPDSTYATVAPVVQFLPDGTAVVAWGGEENSQPVIADSVRPPGADSQFGAANSYVPPPNTDPTTPGRSLQIAPGEGDSATLLWDNAETDWLSSDEYVEDDNLMVGRVDAQGDIAATSVPGASTEEHVVDDSQASYSGTEMMTYALAADDAGDLAVVWGVNPAPGSSTASGPVYGSYAASRQPFQNTPDLIDANVYAGAPIVGSMLASGTAVFAAGWESTGTQYVERTRSAASFPATLMSLPDSGATDPQLVAGAGEMIAQYAGDDGLALYSALAPDGEPFGSPTLLADTGESAFALAGDGSGNAITAFDENSTSSNQGNLMTDTFAAGAPSDPSGQGSAPGGTEASGTPTAPSDTTTASSPAPAKTPVAANGRASLAGTTSLGRLALHLTVAIARFGQNRARTTLLARCVTASGQACVFAGRLYAARWQPRTREWVTTRIVLGTSVGTLHRSRLGQLTVQLTPAGMIALRHTGLVNAWLSGMLRSAGQRISVAEPIRLER